MSRSRVPKILRTNVREAALKKVMISRAQGQSVRKLVSERMNEIGHYSSNEFVYMPIYIIWRHFSRVASCGGMMRVVNSVLTFSKTHEMALGLYCGLVQPRAPAIERKRSLYRPLATQHLFVQWGSLANRAICRTNPGSYLICRYPGC